LEYDLHQCTIIEGDKDECEREAEYVLALLNNAATQAARITALTDAGQAVVDADDARRTDEYDRWLSNLVIQIGRFRATLATTTGSDRAEGG
jgi:hypothetical protein